MNEKSNILSERIKELRKSKGWNQSEFATKINTDTRMVSLYEGKKSTPSVEVLIKIAKVFNVSTDYLLFENVPRQQINKSDDPKFIEKLQEIENLSDRDKETVEQVIDALITKNKMVQLASKVS